MFQMVDIMLQTQLDLNTLELSMNTPYIILFVDDFSTFPAIFQNILVNSLYISPRILEIDFFPGTCIFSQKTPRLTIFRQPLAKAETIDISCLQMHFHGT